MVSLKMLQFFLSIQESGTQHNYWSELTVEVLSTNYVIVKKSHLHVETHMDIGGGWPIKTNLFFDYDYHYGGSDRQKY